jgi:quercetin dioxygenase-like cupin family protein
MTQSSRHFSIRAADGPSYYVIGDVITVKVTAQETNSAYLMVEVVSQPGGGPWFLHTHEPQETFTVLEGVFEVYGQGESGEKYAIRAEVGDSVHVPGNVPHGFKNVGDQPGRMILTYQPAETMLEFFQEIGIPMTDRHTLPDLDDGLDMDKIMQVLQKYLGLVEMPG